MFPPYILGEVTTKYLEEAQPVGKQVLSLKKKKKDLQSGRKIIETLVKRKCKDGKRTETKCFILWGKKKKGE